MSSVGYLVAARINATTHSASVYLPVAGGPFKAHWKITG